MANLNTNLTMTTLSVNVNMLTTPIKKWRLSDWIKTKSTYVIIIKDISKK